MENYFIIWYMITGWIVAFDLCYHYKENGKQLGLADTGIHIVLCVIFWLPALILCIYGYGLKALWEIITEEEDDD